LEVVVRLASVALRAQMEPPHLLAELLLRLRATAAATVVVVAPAALGVMLVVLV
jgi:hypothetical protein